MLLSATGGGSDDIFGVLDPGSAVEFFADDMTTAVPALILVVVCSGLLRSLLVQGLAGPEFRCVIGDGGDLGSLRTLALRWRPAAAIVDLSCQLSIATVELLSRSPFGVPVLALGDRGSEREITLAIAAGAAGYLPPDEASAEQLQADLRSLAAGRAAFSLSALRALAESCVLEQDAASSSLTAQQRRVVALAASGQTNREIASALSIEVSTVKKHLNAAFAALGVSGRAELRSVVSQDGRHKRF